MSASQIDGSYDLLIPQGANVPSSEAFGNLPDGAFFDGSDSTFNSADADSLTSTTTSEGSAVLTYTTADRHIATMNYGFDFNTDAFGGGCAFWGEMLYS